MTEPTAVSATAAPRVDPACPPAAAPSPMSALRMLTDAKRLIDSDREVATIHERVVRAACAVTAASHGGIALLGVDGEIVGHAHHGLSGTQIDAFKSLVGPVSCGRGSSTERVEQLAAAGLRCFAIEVRGEPVAELHLPRSAPLIADGRAADGTPADDVLCGLLDMIGDALDAAHLQADAARSKDWLAASGMVARSLLESSSTNETWNDIVRCALRVADADYASLVLPRPGGLLEVALAVGVGADDYRGFLLDPLLSRFASAAAQGIGMIVSDLNEVMRDGFENVHGFGPIMMAPLADAVGVRGSIVVARTAGRTPFTGRDLDLARTFADQVALTLEMDDARARCSWMSVLEDRHRIARDLHDNVMQRLFTTGVGLQSLASRPPTEVASRLQGYVDELDETIDEIRSRVFGLQEEDDRERHRPPTRFPYLAVEDGL